MLAKIVKLLFRKETVSIASFLKKLLIDRKDLIKYISFENLDVESPFSAYLTLAILLKEKGEYYKSLKTLEKLKNQDLSENEKRLVYLNLALVYKSAGFIDRAEKVLKEGISLFPYESFFYYEIAEIKKFSGKLEEAVEYLEKAVDLCKDFEDELVHTKLYLADSYIENGRTDKAFRILRKIDLKVPVPLFYYVLSKLYYSVGDKEKGFRYALKGIKLAPKKQLPFLKIVEEFEGLSLEKLRKVAKELDTSCEIGKLLAKKLLEEGNQEELLSLLDKLNKKCSTDPEIKELYLRILWESGKRKQVVDEVVKFLTTLKEKRKLFKCESCGFETNNFDWICPRCKEWESLEINSEDS
ncbi:MAG: tetratricopeptide repeat protein [Desulfurobacteriaceae bacterium]